jgi:Domain of unknown function (DUF4861)
MANIAKLSVAILSGLLLYVLSSPGSAQNAVRVTGKNELDLARPSETISLPGPDLSRRLGVDDLRRAHVRESGGGREILVQSVDTDGDSKPDELVFQADFGPKQSRSFELSTGAPQVYTRDQFRVYGRFVRERFDDFAWENDRIAHRMYGTALETWEKEPLTSSTVDIWCKRVRRLIVNDWYMVDNYHEDTGEGADFYSAGRSRGCGGSGIWDAGKLWVSRNFVSSKVLANGPVRLVFELTYAPWDANGRQVSETKRITLDAGWNLDRFESFYHSAPPGPTTFATGIKKGEGSAMAKDALEGWLRTWEPVRKGQSGHVGCAIVADPATVLEIREADGNYLVVARSDNRGVARYHAGFGWDRSGDFADESSWAEYVRHAARRLQSPIAIVIDSR